MRIGVSSAYCWSPSPPASVHKSLERPIAPLVVTASAVAQGFESGRCRTRTPGLPRSSSKLTLGHYS